MRALVLVAGAALTLSACNNANDANEVDTLAVNNLIVDGDAMTADANAMVDPATGLPMDANAMATDNSLNAAEQKDLTTNDADTNLANGL